MGAPNSPIIGFVEIDPNQTGKVVSINAALVALEQGALGFAQITMGDADYTLTTPSSTVSNPDTWHYTLKITGTLTAQRNIIIPNIGRVFDIQNATTGGFAIVVKTAGSGTTVSISNGGENILRCDGSNNVISIAAALAGFNQLVGVGSQTISTATATVSPSTFTQINLTINASTTLTIGAGAVDSQVLKLRALINGAFTLAFDSSVIFGSDVPTYTASGSGKTDLIGLQWDATKSKWLFVAVQHGF